MPSYPLTGGCLCGGVRFEVTDPPTTAGYCHCTRCQRRTGTAASAQARVAPGSVRVTQGEALLRAYRPEQGFAKVFCSECGSALFSHPPDDPEIFSVRLGALDPGHGITPEYRQWVDFAAEWEPVPDDGLTRLPGSRWT